MAEIIESTYELIQRIGSGGGGVVYLARHIRLDKQVVLKADKRKLSTRPDLLRREVDVLKNLSHPYIPQVYDFFTDGSHVYTVMDYIDGESLDKALERGEHFPQPQVIRWGRQLLQALDYLHSPIHGTPPHGYVHSDIKPANLMRRLNGDICLIDFNISLALGELNVIGVSAGYASPEHYGLDFSLSDTETQGNRTLTLGGGDRTLTMPSTQSSLRRRVVPDIRSDIYSTGATLYHLLSGRRPAKNAWEVIPLSPQEASPQLVRIITKAMEPNVNLRYQTASEMLWELDHLRENDPRTRRQNRQAAVTAVAFSLMLLAGGAMTFGGLRQMQKTEQIARLEAEAEEAAQRTAKEALVLIGQSEDALERGDTSAAAALAAQAWRLESPYRSQAQRALTEALGVYDLSAGFKPYLAVELSSEPIKLALSPAGYFAAVLESGRVSIFSTGSGEEMASLPADSSALSSMVFLGEDRILYSGEGALTAYCISEGRVLWNGEPATKIALSGDGTRAAAIYKDASYAAFYDTESGTRLGTLDFEERRQRVPVNDLFADPEGSLFALDMQGDWVAASFADGSLILFDLSGEGDPLVLFENSDYCHFEGGFFEQYFAFSATKDGESVFAVVDLENRRQTGGFSSTMPFHTAANESGVYVSTEDVLVRLNPVTGEQEEIAYTVSRDIAAFAANGEYALLLDTEGTASFFDQRARQMESYDAGCDQLAIAGNWALLAGRDTPTLRILRLEDHSDALLLTYDPSCPHDEARISADKASALLYRYDKFWIYQNGLLVTEQALPEPGQVYDQQYRREGGEERLEVLYRDGTLRSYRASDGLLLSEEKNTPPDPTLYEEFHTDHLRITSPLHEPPAVYDAETGEFLCELEKDAYLTYVTQIGDKIMTEYVTTDGKRYGLLLDENCQTLARLPNLCDILPDGTLVFDDNKGNLRQSRIYSSSELLALEENK